MEQQHVSTHGLDIKIESRKGCATTFVYAFKINKRRDEPLSPLCHAPIAGWRVGLPRIEMWCIVLPLCVVHDLFAPLRSARPERTLRD